MVKGDGSVLIHSDGGSYKPLNWMPPPCSLEVLTPRDHAIRGSQVSIGIDQAFPVSQALIDRGVIVDFREPNIVRFGFSPLVNQFAEAERAAKILSAILENEWFLDPAYRQRHKVT